jgi:hypothetical protein
MRVLIHDWTMNMNHQMNTRIWGFGKQMRTDLVRFSLETWLLLTVDGISCMTCVEYVDFIHFKLYQFSFRYD